MSFELDISKNLLQMNFMRRTLVTKERTETLSFDGILTSADFKFSMPSSVRQRLAERLDLVSNQPIVRHVAGRGIATDVGMRASYGGFNTILSGCPVELTKPERGENERTNNPPMKYPGRQFISPQKRKSVSGDKAPKSAKKPKRKRSL